MLTLRYILRLSAAFIKKFKYLIIIGIFAGVGLFVAISAFLPGVLLRNTEIIGITGRYHADALPNSILSLMSEGLTSINDKGEPVPALARSWDMSDGGKVWTFYLDESKKWQDGKAVTSGTINYSFSDVSVEYPDDKTIVFKLDSEFAPFPTVVSRPVFRKGLMGTGDWRVDGLSLSGEYVEKLTIVNSDKETKIYKFYPTEEATKVAFKLGEIDKIEGLFDADPFDRWPTAEVTSKENDWQFVAVFFNTQRNDTEEGANQLSSKEVRQALSYAVNNKEQGLRRIITPISPVSWAYNPQVKTYDYSPERAREILDDAVGDGGTLDVKLATSPLLLNVADALARDWREVGVNTSVQVTSVVPSEYDAYLIAYDIPKDPDQYALWHSTQMGTNISRLNNPRIDKLLEDGRIEVNKEERKKIYIDLQRFLLEEAPAMFLYQPRTYEVTRK